MAGQKFTLTFDANLEVSKMKTALNDVQKSLNGLQLPQNITKNLQSTFQKLTQEVQNFEVQAGKDITSKADFSKLEKSADRINNLFGTLKVQLKDIGNLSNKELQKLLPDDVSKNISDANNALKTYNTTLKNIQGTIDSTSTKITEQQNKLKSYQAAINQLVATKSTKVYDSLKQTIQDTDGTTRFETEAEALQRLQNEYQKVEDALTKYQAKVGNNPTAGQQTYITRLTNQLNNLKTAYNNLSRETTTNVQADAQIKTLESSAKNAQTQITKLQANLQQLLQGRQGAEAQALQNLLNALKQVQGIDFSKFSQDAQGAGQAVKAYLNDNLQQLITNLQNTQNSVGNQTPVFNNFRQQVQQAGAELVNFDNRMREVEQLKSRIQYFFGLNNAIQLVKRTMREAYQTIKELDKAMTETAVVTDFSVGDMWAQLPDYTKRANELGVSTKAAYEAATLYYQQGLKTNEVMAMSNETLKMARIAGLDAAVATDRMTNAIRGFNMEINTTNAQRIDDVYSRLAAISASNVDEISTAMTKVASLAHSANMEFETTAAFLAQIIETTRESAETAGTALKTVVARFSEVKKLVSEGELSGADEEGELIDVNKVSSALRVAGIDLNKYFLGQVGLDDIFMELASKWNQLTTLQQRYIATQAAGSRQQSRFIALMSDYARTQELVGEAYNANGAAAKQFEKTQESLESKLARLKNAWNEFAMGVLNSDIVKAGVDVLTGLLNGINALTSGFGTLNTGAGKFLNTFAKLTLLIGGLKVGKGLTAGLFGSMLSAVTGGKVGGSFMDLAASAMGINPGKNFLGTLSAGAFSPFKNIATGIGGKLSSIGFNAINANYAGGTALSGKLAAGVFGKLTGAGMATGAAQGIAGAASLLPAIAGITAAAGAAYVAIKKLYDASPAGQIKIAEKYADSLSEVANAAKASQREFESVQEEYSRLEANVQQATTAEERTEAIKSRTEYIQSLLEQNATYAQYIDQYEVKNGEIFLTLDSDKLAEACEKIAETATRVQSGADIANANVAFQKYQKVQSDVEQLEEILKEAEADRDNQNIYEQTEEGRQQWREDWNIDELEAELVSAQSKMVAFQKEYESFVDLGISKYLSNIEKTDSGTELTDESKIFAAEASKYSFNGDTIQKRIAEETTRFFGLVSAETLGTLEGARDSFIKQFETTIIPEDLKNDEKGLINAVAFDKAIKEVLGPVSTNVAEGFLGLSKEYQDILLDLMNTGGDNIKRSMLIDVQQSLPKILSGIWGSLDKKLQEKLEESAKDISYKPFETITQILSQTFKDDVFKSEASDRSNDPFTQIYNKIWMDFLEEFDLSVNQTGIITKIFANFAKDNYDSLDDFSNFIRNLIDTISKTGNPDDLTNFFDALATLDTNSATNINTFFNLLDGLGIDFRNVEGSAEAAADKLKELANVKDPFNAEELSAKVSDAISTIWDIRERKSTQQGYRTFGENEYKAIQDAIEATGSKIDISTIFKRTGIKNKEWNYVGGDLEELVQLLIQDLNNAIQQAEDYISEPEWLKEQPDFATNDVIKVEDQNFTLEEAFREIISNPDFIEKLQNTEQLQPIIAILEKMGYTWSESLSREGLVGIISEALMSYDQSLANKESQTEIDRAVQSVDYLTSVNELPNRPGMDSDRYQSAIEGKFAVDEHAEDRYESILKGLKQLDAAGVKWGKTAQDLETISRALSLNWSEQASKLSELTEVLDKNDKILYEGSKDSYEYSGAIHAVGEAMRAAYGEQITDEFVQAHIQQIVMARESEEAYQELLNLLQQDFFSNAINGGNEFEQQLWDLQQALITCGVTAEQLDGFKAEGVAVLDGTPWMNVIRELWGSLEAFEAYLATSGWTVVYGPLDDKGLPTSAQLVRNQPTGYSGYQPYTGSNWGHGSSGGSGGSGSSAKEPTKEEWRSDFDWLYNLMEDLAELQREQNKLQEEQNKILELGNDSDTGKDLYENLVKQMANLLTQKTYQSSVQSNRRREMQEFMAANAAYGNYLRFNNKDQTLEINWDAINNIGDKETYEKVKDLVSEAEAIQKKMDESDDALRDIEAQIRHLEDIWRESYVDFEKRVLDALVKSYQRTIDNYSDLNNTVNKANEEILSALQEEIALERQIRNNTKTEETISDTEARLAFLRRDTTGGNQVAILKTQKELEEARQSYEDTLIDQSISRLQDDNAKAAEQREKQIELMQAQLDYAAQNGEFNNDVQELISGALGADGELLTNSDLFNLLQQEESWAAMSATNKELWEDELNNTFKEVSAYLLKEQGEIDGSYLQAVASQINDGVWASASIVGSSLEVGLGSMGQSIGWAIGSMSQAIDHIVYSYDNAVSALNDANAQMASNMASSNTNGGWVTENINGRNYTYNTNNPEILEWIRQIKAGTYDWTADPGRFRYATGGLNTKTGPAWLDGTPSEPEYVLNARQTEAFLKLADVLPSMFNNASTTTNNIGGTMYLNFDINVDNISNDYDVDQLVERVKDDIYSAASYRNANIISLSR